MLPANYGPNLKLFLYHPWYNMKMDIKTAIKNQHHAALAMMRQAVQECPIEVWVSGTQPRTFWRITHHALAYAHLYLYENVDSWKRWPLHDLEATYLDGDAAEREPYTKAEMLQCVDLIDSEVDARVDALDFDAPHCGFTWYPNVSQVELMILSLRHLHGHIGQLHEHLLAHEIDVEWIGQWPRVAD